MISTLKNTNMILNYIRRKIIKSRDAQSHLIDKRIAFKNSRLFNDRLNYQVKSFGNKNPKKTFYVIQRSPGGGMFSNLNYIIHHLYIADKLGFIPVIDMENYLTIYNEKKRVQNTFNAWEYFFEPVSKYKLKDVYESKKVILTDGRTNLNKFFDGFENLSDEHYKIFKKYIKIKKYLIKEKNNFIKKEFKNSTVLGVHFRGTDYKNRERHPFPPTKKQMIRAVKKILNKHKYNKVFLVTEEKDYLEAFKKEFPNLIFYAKSHTKKKNIFFDNFRRLHRYNLGKENIVDMLILSKADHIIISGNLSVAALYFSKRKIKTNEVFNGFNSNNIFVAQILWYVKSILSPNMGGFKEDILK